MNYLLDWLRLIRIKNLLMMTGTQVLAYYCLTYHLIGDDLLKPRFLLLLAATFLAGASGYIINDYLDVKIDQTNKPEKVIIGYRISRRWAMFTHLLFNVAAFVMGLLVSVKLAAAIILCAMALWFYSVVLKKCFFTGNLLIALLSAFVLVIVWLYDPSASPYLIGAYAWFACILNLIREILKDVEDMQGDEAFDSHTIPIIWGVRRTRLLLMQLCGVAIFSILIHITAGHAFITYTHRFNALFYTAFLFFFTLLPLVYLIFKLNRADKKADFTQLSSWCKWIMLMGMLSMILIKW